MRKILLTGICVGVLFIFLDMAVAISTAPLYAPYSDMPIWKAAPDLVAGIFFDIINGLMLAGVYSVISGSIPGRGWRRGLNYGVIVGLFRVVMGAFSTFVMYDVPVLIVSVTAVAGFVEILLLCVALSLVYERIR